MNNKAITLSVVMAIIAMMFVESYVSSIEEKAKKEYGTEILVVTASKDIQEMQSIDETMLSLKTVPKKFLEPAAISFTGDKDKAEKDLKDLAGTVAIVPIKSGEQLTFNKLTEPSIRTGLSPQIKPGYRALAIPIDETAGVAKLIKPGDRVDVIVTLSPGKGSDKITRTILQDVLILATGKNVTNNIARLIEKDPGSKIAKVRSLASDDRYGTVTLEVDPSQAQLMAHVVSSSDRSIVLALRNNDDTERNSLRNTDLGDVLGIDSKIINLRNSSQRKSRVIPFAQ